MLYSVMPYKIFFKINYRKLGERDIDIIQLLLDNGVALQVLKFAETLENKQNKCFPPTYQIFIDSPPPMASEFPENT